MAIDKNTEVLIKNRYNGTVGYDIPNLHIRRKFLPGGEQMVSWGELEALYQTDGGEFLLKNRLVITDDTTAKELFPDLEPEYFYTKDEVIEKLNGNYDAFLDMLDFAPIGVLDLIKDCAVEIEVNDINKRDAILNKLGFDVTNAIKIKNTKSEAELEGAGEVEAPAKRRVTATTTAAATRRVSVDKK